MSGSVTTPTPRAPQASSLAPLRDARSIPRRLALLGGAVLVLGWAIRSEARPGGGSTFRASSGSSPSSGGTSSSSPRSSSGDSSSSSSSSSSSDDGGVVDAELVASVVFGGLFGGIGYGGAILARPLRQSFKRGGSARTLGTWLKAPLGLALFLGSLAFVIAAPDWIARGCGGLVLLVAVIEFFSDAPAPTSVTAVAAAPTPHRQTVSSGLAALRSRDPGFSRLALLDFVQALFTRSYTLIGTGQPASVQPFASDEALETIARYASSPVDGIVVGALHLTSVKPAVPRGDGSAEDQVTVEIEANYTLNPPGAAPSRQVVRETWSLVRASTARSLDPARMRVLSCPACGAPAEHVEAATCSYCRTPFVRGEHQWMLSVVWRSRAESFSTEGLGETVPEQGTEAPTAFESDLAEQAAGLAAAHGLGDFRQLEGPFIANTVTPVFLRMYAAWTSKRWGEVRHLLGDRLWESQRFWVRAYEERGLTNRLDDVAIERIETARVERDAHFEAITVRVFAACRDTTVDAYGRLVGGSPHERRRFSEYWTFVRGVAAANRPAMQDRPVCPACGAALDRLGEAGICGYCNAKVTTGDFGWVLTMITQDEVYHAGA